MECTVDLGIQFCERCGRDRDAFAATRAAFRDCPGCGSACCPDCWNLVESACLVCAPFRLRAETSRSRVIPAAAAVEAAPGTLRREDDRRAPGARPADDPYADLRDAPAPARAPAAVGRPGEPAAHGSWEFTRGTARQRPREVQATGIPPTQVAPDAWRAVVVAAEPPRPRRPRHRGGRVAIAAVAGWLVVGALAVAVLGASPGGTAAAPATPAPPSAPPVTPGPVVTPTIAPTAKPTPKPTPKPTRATPRPVKPVVVRPAATAKPARQPTPRPVKPVVVAPPPAITPPPAPTPAAAPETAAP